MSYDDHLQVQAILKSKASFNALIMSAFRSAPTFLDISKLNQAFPELVFEAVQRLNTSDGRLKEDILENLGG